MSGKDQSVTSRESLMSTKPGRSIIKQALLKSKGSTYLTNTKKRQRPNSQILQKDLPKDYYMK